MRATDPEHIAFARPTELLFDIANTVDGVTSNPLERDDAAIARAIILVASFGLVAKPTSAGT